jgi:hypothetical protein
MMPGFSVVLLIVSAGLLPPVPRCVIWPRLVKLVKGFVPLTVRFHVDKALSNVNPVVPLVMSVLVKTLAYKATAKVL